VKELLLCAQYRQPRNAEVGGKASGRWNPLPRTQTAFQNGTAKSVVDLSVYRDAEGPVERKVKRQGKREAGIDDKERGRVQSGYADWAQDGDGESTNLPNIGRGSPYRLSSP